MLQGGVRRRIFDAPDPVAQHDRIDGRASAPVGGMFSRLLRAEADSAIAGFFHGGPRSTGFAPKGRCAMRD